MSIGTWEGFKLQANKLSKALFLSFLQQEVVERAREQIRRAPTSGNNDQQQIPNNAEQIQCSVCLGPITYPVETNCGHSFCAECVLAYWHADRWPSACRCPVCRREVTLLLSDQWFERNGRYPAGITHQIQDYNMRMSGQLRPVSSVFVLYYNSMSSYTMKLVAF